MAYARYRKYMPILQKNEADYIMSNDNSTNSTADIEKIIIDCFKEYGSIESRTNSKSVFIKNYYENVQQNKFLNAIDSYAKNIDIDDIIIYVDSTLRGDAKYGMIITKDTLYYRSRNSKESNSIRLTDIIDVNSEIKLFGNKFDITDSNGTIHKLGQVTSLKKPLLALENSFKNLIEKMSAL